MATFNYQSGIRDGESFSKNLVKELLSYSKYLLFWLFLCMLSGYMYLRYASRTYLTGAKIILQDEKKPSGEMSGLPEFSDLAKRSVSSAGFVKDQIEVIKSRSFLRNLVLEKSLQYKYYLQGRILEKEITEFESPIQLIVKDKIMFHRPYQFSIKVNNSSVYIKEPKSEWREHKSGILLKLPIGHVNIVIRKNDWNGTIIIRYLPLQHAVNEIQEQMTIGKKGEIKSFLVPISMRTNNKRKAEIIINGLIQQYNRSRTQDKLSIYKETGDFISTRFEIIEKYLKSIDNKKYRLKSKRGSEELKTMVDISLKNLSLGQKKVLDLKTSLYMIESFIGYISNNNVILPVNLGLNERSISLQVEEYNKRIIDLIDLSRYVGKEHPEYIVSEKTVSEMRNSIKRALENLKINLLHQINSFDYQNDLDDSYLKSYPEREDNFQKMFRDEKVIEAIYFFLLKKIEQNKLIINAEPVNLKIVDTAYSFSSPISPRPIRVFLICLGIGIVAPILMIYIKNAFDNKINSPEDLQDLPVPLIGTLPRSAVVGLERHLDSGFTESLRMVRTNIPYMLGRTEVAGAKKILVTSSIPSEGKSFVSVNLATIHSLAGYRVLLIGADLRAPNLSRYLTSQPDDRTNGLSDYLAGNVPYEALLQKDTGPREIDVIFSGTVPPNPAELLLNGRIERLLEHYSGKYDYIILDSAPYSKVTDTQIIVPLVDLTLYVVRAGVHDKNYIRQLKIYFNSRKFGRTGLILNDFEEKRTFSKIVGNKIL
ncbi:polysaccharide biosynthesis tyrosine autokinase [Sphingobacterium sp. CZ-2]|uniref:polysaccharide biosynthesis tyrosine autokinase n=1 Tax=Sphingobacterium sp. CZ-2 TaxID=2557994 RepID=UPI0014300F74|nr:polysaccharide biosynthesis tyrosine autokinase [Sphingobacterium sp. CZ-2]